MKYFLILVTCLPCFRSVNLVLILLDDLGYNDIGLASPTVQTPTLDYLASHGMRFTQFYAAAPLCTPSRAALLTGKWPVRVGTYCNLSYPEDNFFRVFYPSSVGSLPKNATILPEYVKYSSWKYRTALIGKWHLGSNNLTKSLPIDRGFDEAFYLPYSHEEGYPTNPEGYLWPPIALYDGNQIIEQPANLTRLTSRYTDRALRFLEEVGASRQPFFLHVAYEQPHYPLFASSPFLNSTLRGLYGDAVAEADNSIGLILQKLKATNLEKDTLIIVGSDNGAWTNVSSGLPNSPTFPFQGGCNSPLFGEKGSTYEGGQRVLSIFYWAGKIAPSIQRGVASYLDVLPTFFDLIGYTEPSTLSDLDGYSLVPMLLGLNQTSPYLSFPFWREGDLYAVRYGPYKCHWYTRDGFGNAPPVQHDPCLLFQLEWDPSEQFPLPVEGYETIRDTMNQEYDRIVAETLKVHSEYLLQDFSLVPCCRNSQINLEQIVEAAAKYGESLEMWNALNCTCS